MPLGIATTALPLSLVETIHLEIHEKLADFTLQLNAGFSLDPVRPISMDPLSALGVAGNVLQFVDFSAKVISTASELYRRADSSTLRNRDTEILVKDFLLLTQHRLTNGNTALGPSLTQHQDDERDMVYEFRPDGIAAVVKSSLGLVGHSVGLQQYAGTVEDGNSMAMLAQSCSQIGNELLDRLQGLKFEGAGGKRVFKSLKAALRALWREGELQNLKERLNIYKEELQWHIIMSLR